MADLTLKGARIFDGTVLHEGKALVVESGTVTALIPDADAPANATVLRGGVLAPGLVDLQVNGGAGVMVGAGTDAAALARIVSAEAGNGTLAAMPTLITDRPEVTRQVIAAGIEAARQNVPGFLGLHLEGPHLDPRRAGAHDPQLIRRMEDDDLALLLDAAQDLPALMVTLAPESVTPAQIAALARAGVIVSLGHTGCTFADAEAAFAAGASMVTHLFNAMGGLHHREPGLAAAVLSGQAKPAAGLIADGVHVHPAMLKLALAQRQQGLFLVSDCMGFAGTDRQEMQLHGREVRRRNGRLELEDGTLAGADLTLASALGFLVTRLNIAPERALAMATSIPARLIGAGAKWGHIAPGRAADLVWFGPDWMPGQVWRGGKPLG